MLEVYGRGYVIDHCMSSFYKYTEEHTYRIYVTDVLRFISGEKALMRYYDIINVKKKEPEKSAKEVKEQIKGRFRL